MLLDDELQRLDERRKSAKLLDKEVGVDVGVDLLENSRRNGEDVEIVVERRFDARTQDDARRSRSDDHERHVRRKLDDEVGEEF